ncbi:MAG: hypothetical protein ABH883_04885, partial [Candidatus Omnitrophota bacterium]
MTKRYRKITAVLTSVLFLITDIKSYADFNLAAASQFSPLEREILYDVMKVKANLLYLLNEDPARHKTIRTFVDNVLEKNESKALLLKNSSEKEEDILYQFNEGMKFLDGCLVPCIAKGRKYWAYVTRSAEDQSYEVEAYLEDEKDRGLIGKMRAVRKEGSIYTDQELIDRDINEHERLIDWVLKKKAREGLLSSIPLENSLTQDVLSILREMNAETLYDEFRALSAEGKLFLVKGDNSSLKFAGHASDRGIYLVEGKGDNVPLLFWEIMKRCGTREEKENVIKDAVVKWLNGDTSVLKNSLPGINSMSFKVLKYTETRAYRGSEEKSSSDNLASFLVKWLSTDDREAFGNFLKIEAATPNKQFIFPAIVTHFVDRLMDNPVQFIPPERYEKFLLILQTYLSREKAMAWHCQEINALILNLRNMTAEKNRVYLETTVFITPNYTEIARGINQLFGAYRTEYFSGLPYSAYQESAQDLRALHHMRAADSVLEYFSAHKMGLEEVLNEIREIESAGLHPNYAFYLYTQFLGKVFSEQAKDLFSRLLNGELGENTPPFEDALNTFRKGSQNIPGVFRVLLDRKPKHHQTAAYIRSPGKVTQGLPRSELAPIVIENLLNKFAEDGNYENFITKFY